MGNSNKTNKTNKNTLTNDEVIYNLAFQRYKHRLKHYQFYIDGPYEQFHERVYADFLLDRLPTSVTRGQNYRERDINSF